MNEIIGKRLKEVRKYFDKTQKEIADTLEMDQNVISRIESGKNVSGNAWLTLLHYYSKFIRIDALFSDNFDLLINNSKDLIKPFHVESIFLDKMEIIINQLDSASKQLKEMTKK